MNKIHPTAIVGSKVQLGENIEIGPYVIVGDNVQIGDDCTIQAHAVLNDLTLGKRNQIGYGAIIGAPPQDYDHKISTPSTVVIGDDNIIREYVTIHRGTKSNSTTSLGHKNMLMTGVHLGHNCQVGDRNIVANNCLLAGYVTVGDDVVMGGGAVFHQFIRIGNMVMIRGGTGWSKDIPPYTIGLVINTLAGLNAVGMRRKGLDSEARKDVKRAYHLVFRSGFNVSQALETAGSQTWSEHAKYFLDFVEQRSKRGLCRGLGKVSQNREDLGGV